VLLVGLGRFGGAMAEAPGRLGHEVLAVDADRQRVQEWSGRLHDVVQADPTDAVAMRQLGASDFEVAVVAIGSDIEASILPVRLGTRWLGVKQIWSKAITAAHGRILQRVGAAHVGYPEGSMGERVAHLISGKILDYIECDDGFTIVKTRAPREAWGRSLADSALRARHGVTVIGVKGPNADFTYATPDTGVNAGDLLIVCGSNPRVENFAATTWARSWRESAATSTAPMP
jgi:trk system potassium uptake protein